MVRCRVVIQRIQLRISREVHCVVPRLVCREPRGVALLDEGQLAVVDGHLVRNVDGHRLRAILVDRKGGIIHTAAIHGNGNLPVVDGRELPAQRVGRVVDRRLHTSGVVISS